MSYRSQSEDTPEDIDRMMFDRYRAMTGAERSALAGRLSAAADAMALAGVRARHPEADEAELRLRLCVLKYGEELVRSLMGPLPDDAEEAARGR